VVINAEKQMELFRSTPMKKNISAIDFSIDAQYIFLATNGAGLVVFQNKNNTWGRTTIKFFFQK
jgi:hypothetical protein